MPPLQRTITLADVQYGAVLVGEDLQLDVLGIFEIPFGVDGAVLEVRGRFALRGRERTGDLIERSGNLEAFAAAAARRFERQRQAVLLGGGARAGRIRDRRGAARDDGDARSDHRLARAHLIAHRVDRVRVRPDPGQARGEDRAPWRRAAHRDRHRSTPRPSRSPVPSRCG